MYWHIVASIIVALAVVFRLFYDWLHKSVCAKEEQPRKTNWIVRIFSWLLVATVLLQLIGFDFLPMNPNTTADTIVRTCGLFLIALAGVLANWARVNRRNTWSNPRESSIKIKDHFLATRGAYKFIRHPFYAACILGFVGIELSLASYLLLLIVPAYIIGAVSMIRDEEKLLEKEYGTQFFSYKAKSWKLLPFLY
jgi:protein-S-isoprenylcysteine O-methyltransferase Ste14